MPTDLILDSLASTQRVFDPFGIAESVIQVQAAWLKNPIELADSMRSFTEVMGEHQMQSLTNVANKYQSLFDSANGEVDHFEDYFNTLTDEMHDLYMVWINFIEDRVYSTPDCDRKMRLRAAFWIRQCLSAVEPINNFFLNPSAIYEHFKTRGESSLKGVYFWSNDLPINKMVSMVDENAFTVGENLAMSPGKVIHRSELVEVIQYEPTTEQVHKTPIVMVTPWINKYYILDLDPKKSLVKYCVDNGFTVFITSWKNPTEMMRNTTFDDYMFEGVDKTIQVARSVCNVDQVHALGFCIAGTALSALMAWYNSKHKNVKDIPVAHWTLLCSLVDFEDPGDIAVFIDEYIISYIEMIMSKTGYLDGENLASTFRMLRSNNLVWHYYVHQYLMGREPDAFDILYWNTDSTRLPEAMHSYYLRELYLNNNLVKPDTLTIRGEKIDLRRIRQPLYCLATEQDHITPWHEVFKIASIIQANVKFALSTSGHIAGVVNPPRNPPKRAYWVGDASGNENPFLWCLNQHKEAGTWWTNWVEHLQQHLGKKVALPSLGNAEYKPLCNAPGTYVHNQ